jgi:N-acetyl-gamma-glutamyl-phosphate reductase
VVAASGTTGAGRSAKINLLGSEVMNSLTPYKFGGIHQHTPEIEEALDSIRGKGLPETKISFTPILAPMPRGILSTTTAQLSTSQTQEDIRELYREFYSESPFVIVLDEGQMPQTSSVTGSNFIHIQLAVDSHTNRLLISAAIDNLGKGAAGQAIENANIMMGFNRMAGLSEWGVR